MKHILWGLSLALVMMPVTSNAEIYKWTDKNGVVRYSDIPPPSNIPHESLSKKGTKTPVPMEAPPPAAGPEGAPAPQQQTPEAVTGDTDMQRQEEAAAKQKAAAAEAELKQKQENCTTARANLANYNQGGRIYKMNEKGEREYLGDADLAAGLENAQMEVDKYCQ